MVMRLGLGLGLTRGGGFLPNRIPNLALWLDAADTSTITESGGAVSVWEDKSGNGNDVSQSAGANKPSYSTNKVVFDGTSDYLFNENPFMYDSGGLTIFASMKAQGSLGAGVSSFLSEGSSASNNPIYSQFRNDTSANDIARAYIKNDSGSDVYPQTNTLAVGVFDNTHKVFAIRDTGNEMSMFTNGVLGTGSPRSYTRTGSLTLDRFCVGGLLRASASDFFNAELYELIIYTRALDAIEMNNVGNYLSNKAGI